MWEFWDKIPYCAVSKTNVFGHSLDVTSAHPPWVHLSWPVGTNSRVQGLSTHREHAEAAKATVGEQTSETPCTLFSDRSVEQYSCVEVEFWTHSMSQVPSFVASLRCPYHIAPNLEQSSCELVKKCTVETTLQHGFWGCVSLCAPVVVQCTAFTGLCHQTVRRETGLMVWMMS